jgi:hypothetical protein
MAHEKTIAQSRDRQGADPLADARGSVHASIFEAEYNGLATIKHAIRYNHFLLRTYI